MDNTKPVTQRLIRVLKDRARNVGKAVVGIGRRTGVAQPIPFHRAMFLDIRIATARAMDAFWPAVAHKIGTAGGFVRKAAFPLGNGHLVDALAVGHDFNPFNTRNMTCPDQLVK